jgi:hypothetical protein
MLSYVPLFSLSFLSGKRKNSLPPAHSGSDWTKVDLATLNIHILRTSPAQVLGCGKDPLAPLPARTQRAAAILEECKVIDEPHAIDHIHVGIRACADPAHDPRTRASIGWVLLKYLSLMFGVGRMQLDSVVDDFLIHLLGALGYNDGDLVVLSVASITRP